jgi:hypothetical protein
VSGADLQWGPSGHADRPGPGDIPHSRARPEGRPGGRPQTWRSAPLVWCALVCAAGVGFAQDGLVIRTETRLVLVDAVVRDKAGRNVRDLEARDFQVWEDGKEQTISSFNRESAESQALKAQPQYIAFLFNAGLPQRDQDQVNAFVASYAGRDRYVAAVAYPSQIRVIQNFTDSAERFEKALAQYRPEWAAVRPSSVAVVSSASGGRGGGGGAGSVIVSSPASSWVPSALRDLAEGVVGIRGRKIVVLLDLAAGRSVDYSYVADACNRANLGVYTTNTDLRDLAKRTGGRVIDYKDLGRGLNEVASEQDEHYMLGYTPREWEEGSCHSLRVKVGRPDLEVMARQRYCTVKPADTIAAKVTGKALEQRAATATGSVAASARLSHFYAAPNLALVNLAMETGPLDLKFEKVNGKRRAQLDVLGQAFTAAGAVAGRFSETVKFDFASEKEADAFRKQPYHYRHQFRLGAGTYNVRITFGVGERVMGKVETPLTIEPWDGRRLALSGVAMSTQTREAQDLASDLDPALLEGNKQLIAESHEVLPSGDYRCRPAEPCYCYLEIYDSSLAGLNPPIPKATIRIMEKPSGREASSGEFDLSRFVRAGNSVTPVIFQTPRDLPAGAYTLEFRAASSTQVAARSVDFVVE